jgi:digeranylgeranylglycerophospholipid reductase
MKNNQHDVIVVGAGPVGSYTACLLAKEGLDVGIFERNHTIGSDVNCTGIISGECLKKFDLPGEVITGAINSIKGIAPSGNYIRYHTASPLAYIVKRSLFDSELNKIAVRAGATTYLNSRVEEIDSTGGSFKIRLNTGGEKREFRARAGVIATGLELHSFPKIFRRPVNFLYGAQTDVLMEDVREVEVYFGEKVAPGSFGWVVPVNGKSVKIGLIIKKNPVESLKRFLRHPLIAQRMNSLRKNIKCSPIPLRRIPKSYAERLVIVGEAAGQVKTTTGGGIYFGLLCAEAAAGTIIKAFRCGDYSEKMFKEYEDRWKRRIDPELKAGIILRNIFSRLSDRQIELLIDLAKRDGLLPVIGKANFDWHRDIVFYLIRHLINKKLFGK